MRTAIVNKHRNPDLYEALHVARTGGTKYEGCYITQYDEYIREGEIIGLFMLGEPDYEPPKLGA